MTIKIGDKLHFNDDDGRGHFGRVYAVNPRINTFDFYCFDDPDQDGTATKTALCDGDMRVIDHAPTKFDFVETNPIRLFETAEMPLIEWLNKRRRGITGTESSAIMGFNKYNTALAIYKEKEFAYSEDGANRPDNDHMRLGRDMEDIVAKRFKTNISCGKVNFHWFNVGITIVYDAHGF